jgi:deoxyadenosine/deoxycytidine kinase
MGKLVTIVGNTGCGKTTLAKIICHSSRYTAFLEQHRERPFQETFMQDLKTAAFPNQVDFMLFRAEQEAVIRTSDIVGIQDGGLDQDFHIFTRLFYLNNYLSERIRPVQTVIRAGPKNPAASGLRHQVKCTGCEGAGRAPEIEKTGY